MQTCPFCNKVYDESEYTHCPVCSGELEEDMSGTKVKDCPEWGGIMYWDVYWEWSNCDHTIDTDEDDYDSILEE